MCQTTHRQRDVREAIPGKMPGEYNDVMYVVAILGWSPGFVANRLTALLREYGYGLADGFRVSSQVAEGAQVAIPFATLEQPDQFAKAARELDARLELRLPARAE